MQQQHTNGKAKAKVAKVVESAKAEPVATIEIDPIATKAEADAKAAAEAKAEAEAFRSRAREAAAAATAAAAETVAKQAVILARAGTGPAAAQLGGEIAAIIREATARHGSIDGARAVALWLLRNSAADTAIARAAMASELGRAFRALRKQGAATKASVGLLAFIADEDASAASAQAGKAAAAAAEAAMRRAAIAGDKAMAAAAAAATLRPIFASAAAAAAAAARVWDRPDGPLTDRNRAAALGRLRHLLAAAAAVESPTAAESEALDGAREVLAYLG